MASEKSDEALTPDYAKAIEFLQKWCKGGPWVVVAIDPNKKGIDAATFGEPTLDALRDWLEEQGSKLKRNVYFTVNPCMRSMSKKPERLDIAALSWLHVDIDPRAGEDHEAERARILGVLRGLPYGIPPPTCIIDSGGGYQAFWRLREPHLPARTLEGADDAAGWNKQLELLLGGDNCHNIDRIMRVPFTLNRPDARKRKKGRVLALASVVDFNDTQHDLASFEKAPAVAAPSGGPTAAVSIDAKKVPRFKSLEEIRELRDARYDQCRVLISIGNDPDNPDFGSALGEGRSGPLFYVCCEMVRAGCSDETIYSVITDPGFGISVSVLDKGAGIHRYATRQIERAREEAVDPILREINDEYALVTVGGASRVLWEHEDAEFKRPTVTYMLKEAFLDFWNKRSVEFVSGTDQNGKPKVVSEPAGKWWLRHRLGRAFRDVVYVPGLELPRDVMNLWTGFAVAPGEGSCAIYLDHLRRNVCNGNPEHFDYLIRWMAHAVQRPAERGHVAVVLRGDKGSGKGATATHFGALWGAHFVPVTNPKHVTNFNSLIESASVLFLDECLRPKKDDLHEAILKTMTTEETVLVERKGIDVVRRKNVLHLILSSNAPWIVNASGDERRYFFLHVGNGNRQDHDFFEAMEAEMKAGGYGALLKMLLAVDLSGFNVRRAPKTEALREQMEFSLDPEDEWLLTLLIDGCLPNQLPGSPHRAWLNLVPGPQGEGLIEHAKRVVPKLRDATDNSLQRYLTHVGALCPETWGRRSREFPPLPEMRAAWCEKHGPRDWPGGADANWTTSDPDADKTFDAGYGSAS